MPPVGATLDAVAATGSDGTGPAGRITSAVYSPVLKHSLCLGYVRAAMAEPGTGFSVREGSASLTVVELPLKGDPQHAK